MSIANFPASLQAAIQTGFLEREFEDGLTSVLGFRSIADKENFPNRIGETITKTRHGLKAPVTSYSNPSSNTNIDNGLTSSTVSLEQYTLSIGQLADKIDLNIVTEGVGIASQFLLNARVNGAQASQSLDRMARNALFDAYMGGNTRVKTTLGAAGTTVAVDDVRGFKWVFVNGQQKDVSSTNTMLVTINGQAYTLTGYTVDGSNVSTTPNGQSGTLTFSANVSIADGTAANAVVSSVAPAVLREGGRATTAALQVGDTLTMQTCLKAVSRLRSNAVPTVGGLYNMFVSDDQLLELFQDDAFQKLFQGSNSSKEYKSGQVFELLGLRFIPTTEVLMQTLGNVSVKRAIVCGAGALVEGTFEGQEATIKMGMQGSGVVNIVEGVVQVTAEPIDALKQIVRQSWFWIGGYAVPTDMTANATIIPTASNSYYKRAVIIESA